MAVPTVERPPKGCDATWTAVWRAMVAEMKSVGTWKPALWPLAVDYLHCLRLAVEHRERAELSPVEENRESGLTHAHAGFAEARAQSKQAQGLADLLGITPKAQKALLANVPDAPPKEHPIVARLDELAQARGRKTAHG
jgi:phage terminase small subunit